MLAAIALALSFGAVLTFTAANLSATAQEAFGGVLSVVAVAFVTAMVFWMPAGPHLLRRDQGEGDRSRRHGRGRPDADLVPRGGPRRPGGTALFLWTTARAAGGSSGP
ncbi:FTR1 family protein [Streptomyces sp. L7]